MLKSQNSPKRSGSRDESYNGGKNNLRCGTHRRKQFEAVRKMGEQKLVAQMK